MKTEDLDKLAHHFMITTLGVQPGENVWIEHESARGLALAEACMVAVDAAGGQGYLRDSSAAKLEEFISAADSEAIEAEGERLLDDMKTMRRYIRITDPMDQSSISVPMTEYSRAMGAMKEHRVNHTKWLVVGTPAKDAYEGVEESAEEFEQSYLNVCLLDYGRMAEAVQPLVELLNRSKKVHIKGPETDLTFSIEGVGAVPCTGEINIPDGECFTAPVRDSMNGTIRYNVPTVCQGTSFPWIKFTVVNGRIEDAQTEPHLVDALNTILDTDPGARYFGEWAMGFNPYVLYPIKSTLFDEKIAGSFHLTPGNCYETAPNGNKSAVHWDIVLIQRPEHGGGEIWIDDVLIRKDGLFVPKELQGLNPENLAPSGTRPVPKPGKAVEANILK